MIVALSESDAHIVGVNIRHPYPMSPNKAFCFRTVSSFRQSERLLKLLKLKLLKLKLLKLKLKLKKLKLKS
jgi:hypothetical protein